MNQNILANKLTVAVRRAKQSLDSTSSVLTNTFEELRLLEREASSGSRVNSIYKAIRLVESCTAKVRTENVGFESACADIESVSGLPINADECEQIRLTFLVAHKNLRTDHSRITKLRDVNPDFEVPCQHLLDEVNKTINLSERVFNYFQKCQRAVSD